MPKQSICFHTFNLQDVRIFSWSNIFFYSVKTEKFETPRTPIISKGKRPRNSTQVDLKWYTIKLL